MTSTTDHDHAIEASPRLGGVPSGHYFMLMAATALFLAVLVVVTLNVSPPVARVLLSEGGPIEIASAAAYIVVVVTLFREASPGYLRRHFYLIVVPVVFCMREMDFHTHFTTISVTKSSFYVSAEVPLAEKLLVIAIMAFIAFSGYRLVRDQAKPFLQGLRSFSAPAVAIALAGAFAVASKLLDGIGRKFLAIGIDVGANVEIVSLVMEEVLELGIPISMAIAAFAYFTRGTSLPPASNR